MPVGCPAQNCCTFFIAPFSYGHSPKDTVLDITSELEGSKNGIHISDMRFMEPEIIKIYAKVRIPHQRIHFTVKKDLIDAAAQGVTFFAPNLRCVFDITPGSPPNSLIHFAAYPSPTPGTPGILSACSPLIAARSGYCAGATLDLAYRFRGHRFQVFEMVSRIKHGYRIISRSPRRPRPLTGRRFRILPPLPW